MADFTELFAGQTVDGNSAIFLSGGSASTQNKNDSMYMVRGSGDFGTGTVTLEIDFGDDVWVTIPNAYDGTPLSYSAAFVIDVYIKTGARLRAVLTGATAANLNVGLL
jgi:hypothetical protein